MTTPDTADYAGPQPPDPDVVMCICTPWGGCDEEGDPGCAYCQALDGELPCPADIAAMEDEADA